MFTYSLFSLFFCIPGDYNVEYPRYYKGRQENFSYDENIVQNRFEIIKKGDDEWVQLTIINVMNPIAIPEGDLSG